MTVCKLCGIAYGVGRNSVLTLEIHITGAFIGDDHLEAQRVEECLPEGQLLVHIKHQRQTDSCLGTCRVARLHHAEKSFVFILIKAGSSVLFGNACALFAAISADEPVSVGESNDSKGTFCGTAAAVYLAGTCRRSQPACRQ